MQFKMTLKGENDCPFILVLRICGGEKDPITATISEPDGVEWETVFDMDKRDAINLRNALGVIIDALP